MASESAFSLARNARIYAQLSKKKRKAGISGMDEDKNEYTPKLEFG